MLKVSDIKLVEKDPLGEVHKIFKHFKASLEGIDFMLIIA